MKSNEKSIVWECFVVGLQEAYSCIWAASDTVGDYSNFEKIKVEEGNTLAGGIAKFFTPEMTEETVAVAEDISTFDSESQISEEIA